MTFVSTAAVSDTVGSAEDWNNLAKDVNNNIFPTDTIAMWSGALTSLPTGWSLCDGNGGTPDLIDKFVKSVPSNTDDPGSLGGAHTHVHDYSQASQAVVVNFTPPGDHTSAQALGISLSPASSITHTRVGSGHVHTVGSASSLNFDPVHFELAYIIKDSWTPFAASTTFIHATILQATDYNGMKDDLTTGRAPDGLIVGFNGPATDLPTTWTFCDGGGITPDLTDRFILGITATDDVPGDIGGASTHAAHGLEDSSTEDMLDSVSAHAVTGGLAHTGGGAVKTFVSSHTLSNISHNHSWTINADEETGNHVPRHYEVAFIMKDIESIASTTVTAGDLPFASEYNSLRADATDLLIPTDTIIQWTGALTSVPANWLLCDGNSGTPNLLDLFIKSVPASTDDPGFTGGATEHTHTITAGTLSSKTVGFTIDAHPSSGVASGAGSPTVSSFTHTGITETAHSHTSAADTATSSNLPPFFEVAFIIKL